MRELLCRVAILSAFPAMLAGQTIRGAVVDVADRPVPGVVVLLVGDSLREVARSLTNERGEYRVTAPAPGRYRLRTMRIGFRATTSDAIQLAVGQEITRRLELSGVPFSLDSVRSTGRNACRVADRDLPAATFAVWEQARTALTATLLTANSRSIAATTVGYERTLDAGLKRIRQQTSDIRSDFVTQPWRSLTPDSLRKVGFVVAEPNNVTTYHAPGIDALLSATFLEDHCLRFADGSDDQRLGIAFEPTRDRRDVPEIAGTFWLDRRSAELRSMEFSYVNVTRDQQRHAGGEMDFIRMRNGMWAISRWNIRMPVFVVGLSGPTLARQELRVGAIKVTGGELAVAIASSSRGRDTVWSRPTLVLAGTVVDSLTGTPVRDAHVSVSGTVLNGVTDPAGKFTIPGLLPGRYSLDVRTPSLDSVNTMSQSPLVFTDSAVTIVVRVPTAAQITTSLCGSDRVLTRGSREGVLLGSVDLPGDTAPPKGVKVVAEWREILIRSGNVLNEPRMSDALTDAAGNFRMCGVPINTELTIRATLDSARSSTTVVKIPGNVRYARADLVLGFAKGAVAVFTGVVVADSSARPISDAEVLLPELGLSVRTNERGEFRHPEVLAGTHQVVVRHVGFGALDARLEFAAGLTVDRRIVLSRIVTLDSMLTKAARRDPNMESFEEHRRIGLGHFVTKEEIVRHQGALLSNFLQQKPGVLIYNVPMKQEQRVAGNRPPMSACAFSGSVECLRRERIFWIDDGPPYLCYARVYLDNQIMNPGRPTPPFDLRTVVTTQVEAMEFYVSSAQVPFKYMAAASDCGLLVIHTRRPP